MNALYRTTLALLLAFPGTALAMGEDDPFLWWLFIEQLEWRGGGDEDAWAWDAQGWAGRDLNKFWWKTEGENEDGSTESAELQLLYSRAISPYWNLQAGWRHEARPEPDRDWLVAGLQGMAPYFFHVDANLFFGQSGRVEARAEAEYDFLFTQKLILSPDLEVSLLSKDDPERRLGSGLTSLEAGLRLRYEIRREFAPYIGVHWEKKYGDTADYAREDGLDVSETKWVVGLRAWF